MAKRRDDVDVAELTDALLRLADQLQQKAADAGPPADTGQYQFIDGRIVRIKHTANGPVVEPLANFDARIIGETLLDDGVEQQLRLAIEGALASGEPLPRIEVAADDYPLMLWPTAKWGSKAVVYAGMGTKDHLRAALQLLSGDVPRRTVFAHTGWRCVDGSWCYLHGGGAIGADGPVPGVDVQLPDALANYVLPDPAAGDVRAAIKASLAVLNVAPARVTAPLLGGVFRAPLLEHAIFRFTCAGQRGLAKPP